MHDGRWRERTNEILIEKKVMEKNRNLNIGVCVCALRTKSKRAIEMTSTYKSEREREKRVNHTGDICRSQVRCICMILDAMWQTFIDNNDQLVVVVIVSKIC